MRRAAPLLYAFLLCCSDDSSTPPVPSDGGQGEGTTSKDQTKLPWDGYLPGPSVTGAAGEGKHPFVVIGERVALTGKNLGKVDGVYIGGALAPIVSVEAARVVCRVAPRTPAGEHTIEVKEGDARRFADVKVTVRRLVAIAAADLAKLQTFEASTHNGGPAITLPEPPASELRPSSTGRYLIARAAGQRLLLVDLALETAVAVPAVGSGDSLVSFATAGDDRLIVTAGTGGKLYKLDLTVSPPGAPAELTGAPSTTGVVELGTDVAGFHPSPAAGEGSVWMATADLKTFAWAEKAGAPFTIGGSPSAVLLGIDARGGGLGMLLKDPAVPGSVLVGLTQTAGKPAGVGAAHVPSAVDVVVSAGGSHAMIAGDVMPVELTYAPLSGAVLDKKTISLGYTSSLRVQPFAIPNHPELGGALVGPKPGTAAFVAGVVELVNLTTQTRLTSDTEPGKPALSLANIRGLVADPLSDRLHLIVGDTLDTYSFGVNGSNVAVASKMPVMQLTAGKAYRWIAVQP